MSESEHAKLWQCDYVSRSAHFLKIRAVLSIETQIISSRTARFLNPSFLWFLNHVCILVVSHSAPRTMTDHSIMLPSSPLPTLSVAISSCIPSSTSDWTVSSPALRMLRLKKTRRA